MEVALQAKEDTEKVKVIALTETSAIKDEVQSTIALVKNIDQGQRRPIESLKSGVESLKRGMIDALCLEQWSEEMDSEISSVLDLLGERMKHLEINAGTGCRGLWIWTSELAALEDKGEGQ